jgi:AraC-like DNA-binding protein
MSIHKNSRYESLKITYFAHIINYTYLLTIVELFYDFVISTLVGLFGLHLLTKKGLLASKFLGLYFLNFCIRIVLAYFATGGRLIDYPHLYLLGAPFHFFGPPVAFLFVYTMLFPERKFRLWQALLFLPFLLHLLELIPFFLGPVENKIKEIQLVLEYKSLVNYPGTATFFSPMTMSLLKLAFGIIYSISSFCIVIQFFRKNRRYYAQNTFFFNWMFAFTSLSLLSIVCVIAYVVGWIGFNNLQFSYSDLLMHLSALVNLGVVLYRPSILDGVAFQSLVMRLQKEERQAEPDENAEKLKKYEKHAARLEKYFVTKKPFLTDEVGLDAMAKIMGISARELSRTVHYMYELSYPDFVNSWRINYILEQRKQNPVWQSYSQEMLAELSGFGSRQGMYIAINRLHGMTPATFFATKAVE